MENLTIAGLVLAGALLGAGLAALYLTFRRRAAMQHEIRRTLQEIGHDQLSDLVIPDEMNGQIHLDHVLLTAHGLVVIDIKDLAGAVFAAENMDEWTVLDGSQRFTIRNPLHALEDRVRAVRAVVADEVPVRGRVVFTGRASFPKQRPRNVILLGEMPERFPRGDGPGEMRAVEAFQTRWERLRAHAAA